MNKQLLGVLGMLLFICGARLIPHVANFSPMICVALFAGRFLDKRLAYAVVIVGMLLSDVLLAQFFHYPVFGSWSLFTYSGLVAILFAGTQLNTIETKFTLGLLAVMGSNIGFWLWTNLGVWLFSGMYGLHVGGFTACYMAAIPFLQHSTISALAWFMIFVAGIKSVSLYRLRLALK